MSTTQGWPWQDYPRHPCLLCTTHPCPAAQTLPLWAPVTSCPPRTHTAPALHDVHPKREDVGLSGRRPVWGSQTLQGWVTTPATGWDRAMPMGIKNPTGKHPWAGQGSACPCPDATAKGHRNVLVLQRVCSDLEALGLPVESLFPPEPPGRGLGAPQATSLGGAGWGAGDQLMRRETLLAASC